MPTVRGCHLPDELLYDVDNHIWFQEQPDGTVKLGMTTVATSMAGQLVAFTPKKVGREVQDSVGDHSLGGLDAAEHHHGRVGHDLRLPQPGDVAQQRRRTCRRPH